MAEADLKIKVATDPSNPFKDLGNQLDEVDSGIGRLAKGFGVVGTAIAGAAIAGKAFDFIVDASREMEDLKTQFVAFTGSADAAADQVERLTEFAAKSPFDLAKVAEANRTLLAFGSSTSQSMEQLRQLGEVSAATGKDLGELATIFGQIQAEGKLTGERFNQLIERGVNIGPAIAQSMGVASTSIRKLISDGKISADEVSKAFEKLTGEGGQFFGATARQSETLSASLSSAKDNTTILAAEVGKSLTPALTASANMASQLAANLASFFKQTNDFKNLSESQKEIQRLELNLESLQDKLKDLESGNTFSVWLDNFFGSGNQNQASAIDETIKRINALKDKIDELQKPEKENQRLKAFLDQEKEMDAAWGKAVEKRLAIQFEADEKRRAEQAKAAADQQKKLAENEKLITQISEQEITARHDRNLLIQQQANERVAEENQKALEQNLAAEGVIRSNAEVAESQRQYEANEARRVATLEAATQREAELTTARVEAEAQRQELLGQFDQAEVMRAQDKQTKLLAAQKKGEADRLATIRKAQKEQFDLEVQTATAQKNWDEQTYAQRVATAQTGLNALSGLMKSHNRQAFEIGKAAATAQALVAIPTTAIEAYKSLAGVPLVGPALGAAAAAAAVVAGMEQLRNIQNTRIGFAEGGLVPGKGNKDTVPALLTPGEVVVPQKNFADLQNAMVRDAVHDDQIMLMQQGNALITKIIDLLTYGTVNEKLTLIVANLNQIQNNTANIGSLGAGSNTPITIEQVDTAIQEIGRNDVPLEGKEKRPTKARDNRG